jgi:hypothetical protein
MVDALNGVHALEATAEPAVKMKLRRFMGFITSKVVVRHRDDLLFDKADWRFCGASPSTGPAPRSLTL